MKNSTDISIWLKQNLQEILPCLVSDNLVQSILGIEDHRDLEVYMSTLTNTSDPKYKAFLANYRKIKSLIDQKDNDVDDEYSVKQKTKKKSGSDVNAKDKKSSSNILSTDSGKETSEKQSNQKKKTKYVNLYSAEGKQKDVIFLKGRHPCECQASMHKLINNCLTCGRIVCEQEGSGPCLFCGVRIFSREDKSIINSNGIQSRKLYNTIMESLQNENFNEAIRNRDKLLEYDKSAAQRTKVIDDESEYFSSNSPWLSKEERERLLKKEEEAHKKKHASRLEKKFTLDFAGRTVVEEKPVEFTEEFYAEALEKVESTFAERYRHPDMSDMVELVYETPDVTEIIEKLRGLPKLGSDAVNYRVQDREFLEMSDNGVCLSLHQPWASLLVSGVMRYEGRTWYTSHRGRLWIASASKHPTEDDVKDAERFFRDVRSGENLNFPKSYPTSCLLGCVSVTDCLPQEEFRIRYPDGECDSPFVFICEDPRQLDTLFPVSGSHKIYKLDPKIHHAANKILMRMAKNAKNDPQD